MPKPTLILLAVMLVACDTAAAEPMPIPVVIAVDTSRAADDRVDTLAMLGEAWNVVYEVGGDATVIGVGASLADAQAVFTGRVGPRGGSANEVLVNRRNDRVAFIDGAAAWLDSVNTAESSDYLAALIAAADILPGEGLLIVVGDGINTTDDLNVLTLDLALPGAIDGMVADLAGSDLIPDLAGVEVRWFGFGMSTLASQLSTADVQAIRAFWDVLLTEAGATVDLGL